MRAAFIVCLGAALAGCARAATLPIAQDVVHVTANAAPACGQLGAQQVALRQAAVETIRRGYDRFIIVGREYSDNVRVIGHTPMSAQTYGLGRGSSYTTFSGGQPIVGGSHSQGLTVKMFKADDPAGANAVPARETLGPDWPEIVKSDVINCLQT